MFVDSPGSGTATRREATRRALPGHVFMLLILAFFFYDAVLSQPPVIDAARFPALSGRVVDEAQIFDAPGITALENLSQTLERKTQAQLVVATIPDLGGYAIADYGYQLGRAWALGRKGINDGVLLLVAPNEREVRIEVGYGLEPVLTDAVSRQIIEEKIIPAFKQGAYAAGAIAGARSIAAIVETSGTAQPRESRPSDGPAVDSLDSWMMSIMLAFFSLIPGFGIGQFIYARINKAYGDQRVKIGRRFGGGWGPGGGGPGGSGGFRGRGGSFGGGGASGRW